MIERRFLVSPDALDTTGSMTALIREEEHHHLSRVLRLRIGDEVSVFDGAGRAYRGTVQSISGHETRVSLTAPDQRAVEPSLRVTLAQGIPHHEKMELLVQKTTEIGVAAIVPIISSRTVLRAGHEGRWARLDRWRRVAREAARQCGRLQIPAIAEPIAWNDFMAGLTEDPEQPRILLDAETPAGAPSSIPALGTRIRSALVAVGPEGGWSPEEAALGGRRGFSPMTLGPRILRTETAGIVAVALLLFLAGDLGHAGGAAARPL